MKISEWQELVAREGEKPKRLTRTAWRGLYTAFIAGLKAQGCVLCPTCNAYLFPTHTHRRTKNG